MKWEQHFKPTDCKSSQLLVLKTGTEKLSVIIVKDKKDTYILHKPKLIGQWSGDLKRFKQTLQKLESEYGKETKGFLHDIFWHSMV